MIDKPDIVRMTIRSYEMEFAYAMAEAAKIGGVSHVRGDEERGECLSEDQIVGQVGTLAGHRFMFGNANDYKVTRWYANRNPTVGDIGYDVTGCNVDFKTSLMRSPDRPPLDYNLLVRPRERHDDWIYMLLLVEKYSRAAASVLLVGWASTRMLPDEVATGGAFSGAYVLPARHLNPLMPLRWWAEFD